MESCIVMILLCLILFGIIQVSIVTAAHDVLLYAATSGARCATVGYDDDMVYKTVRMAALPTLGGKQISLNEEYHLVRNYIQYDTGKLSHISDEYWYSVEEPKVDPNGDILKILVKQNYPVVFPFAKAIYNVDYTEFSTEKPDEEQPFDLVWENHANLYLGGN